VPALAGAARRAQVDAVVLKDEVLRLTEIPLVIRLPGMPQAARGAQVKLDLIRWDEVDLTVEARLVEIAAGEAADIGEEEEEEGDVLPVDGEPAPAAPDNIDGENAPAAIEEASGEASAP
jgi:exoribonuclease-2